MTNQSHADAGWPAPSKGVWVTLLVLAVGALGVSAYLGVASTLAGGPIGCGGGSGCEVVLASKWSKAFGLPVSLFAALVYAAAIAAALSGRWGDVNLRRAGWLALLTIAGAAATAAAWFIYLQLGILDAICPYCMGGHALGLVLAATVLLAAPARPWWPLVAGVLAAAALAAVQTLTPATLHRAGGVDVSADRDGADEGGGGRAITLLNGTLRLSLAQEPLLGDPDAERVLALMLDYACPHCRHAHELVKAHQASGKPPSVCAVALPTPVHRACNPYANEEMPARFDESCELARLAIAVHLAEPREFAAFDAWLFEPESPRSAAEARREAERLVGAEVLQRAEADPRLEAIVQRNVQAYGTVGEQRRVPVLFVPGQAPVIGRIDDGNALIELLSAPPASPNP